jgi:hypothetical protein
MSSFSSCRYRWKGRSLQNNNKKMSAFICSEKTLSECYSGLVKYQKESVGQYEGMGRAIQKFLDGRSEDEMLDILYRLNVRAVNQKYGDKTEEAPTKEMLAEMCRLSLDVPAHQFLKSLECLHYQMAEGDIPETKEYKAMEKLIEAVCRAIAHGSKVYAEAHWD